MERELTKKVKVMGREFLIEKLDAYTASYLLFLVMEKFLPKGLENKMGNVAANLPANRTMMSKEEFKSLQQDCLSCVYEMLPARNAPIINDNGTWGVKGLEDNAFAVILLTIHALTFNVTDFFGVEGLKELRSSLEGFSLANLKT